MTEMCFLTTCKFLNKPTVSPLFKHQRSIEAVWQHRPSASRGKTCAVILRSVLNRQKIGAVCIFPPCFRSTALLKKDTEDVTKCTTNAVVTVLHSAGCGCCVTGLMSIIPRDSNKVHTHTHTSAEARWSWSNELWGKFSLPRWQKGPMWYLWDSSDAFQRDWYFKITL